MPFPLKRVYRIVIIKTLTRGAQRSIKRSDVCYLPLFPPFQYIPSLTRPRPMCFNMSAVLLFQNLIITGYLSWSDLFHGGGCNIRCVALCPPFRYVRKDVISFNYVRMRTLWNDCYGPLYPTFHFIHSVFLSFRFVCMWTQRNDCYVRSTFNFLLCPHADISGRDWYVPFCETISY